MNTKLDAIDSLFVASQILVGNDAVAEFNYTDKSGKTTFRRVKVDSVKADDHGNFVWYNYSDGDHGGGHRAFRADRISNFRFVRK